VGTVILLSTVTTTPVHAQPASPSSDLRKRYEELANQATQLDEDLLKAKDDLSARQRDLTKANADIELSGRQRAQAVFDQDQFRGEVDEFAYASFRGARFNEMSALLTSGSAEDFLHRMSALNVLATDGRASMDLLTGAVNATTEARDKAAAAQRQANEAAAAASKLISEVEQRKKDLDGKIKEVRTALNRLSPAERADMSKVKDNGIYLGPPGAANTALQAALSKRGSEYEWAAVGPNEFDCSGLTMWAYNAAGVKLPHSSRAQFTMGRAVALDQLAPGDLLFYDDGTGNPAKIHHVGMYVGDGKMVDAPTEGQVVDVRSMKGDGHLMGARRIAG
jgi:cell wall-associated NlpC family hydrolase